MGLQPMPQGALAAALIHAAENATDHLTHFHLCFMPDFARPDYVGRPWHARAVDRFTAMEGSAQRSAVQARTELLHVIGLLAGKWPHTLAIQPGGVTRAQGPREKARLMATLRAFRRDLETGVFGGWLEDLCALPGKAARMRWPGDMASFLRISADPDLQVLDRGAGRFLSFGASRVEGGPAFTAGGREAGQVFVVGCRSQCRRPQPCLDVGALARQMVEGQPLAQDGGVLARVAARLLNLARTQIVMKGMAAGLTPGAGFMTQGALPRHGSGAGLVEAARGALGHWIRIEGGRIAGYQIIAPTTWDFSPHDAAGAPGPLEGTLVEGRGPLAVQHVVRSFGPCMVCTVHWRQSADGGQPPDPRDIWASMKELEVSIRVRGRVPGVWFSFSREGRFMAVLSISARRGASGRRAARPEPAGAAAGVNHPPPAPAPSACRQSPGPRC